jgi:pilus assembly protein CpaC
MKRTNFSFARLAASAACIAFAGTLTVAPMAPATAAQSAPQNGTVILAVGESKVVNLPGTASDVIVANPNVVDVHVRSQNQIYILAKTPGESTVSITATNGKVLYSASVRVGNNLTSVDQMLRLAMPDADILVSNMNGMTLLTGTIKAPEDAAEAERLVQAYVGKEVTVVSRLRTATPLQVNLQVRISEVNRNLLHKVGTNLASWDAGTGTLTNIGHGGRDFISRNVTPPTIVPGVLNANGSFTPPYVSVPGSTEYAFNRPLDGSTSIGFISRMFGMDIAGALDLAESSGLATSLAQPNLTSLSGETASFLAGGEIPYQVRDSNGGYSIMYKSYGVELSFVPVVMANGRISLRVKPSVSTPDASLSTSNGVAIKSRTAETTVELGSGQAFMIAGLLSNDMNNAVDKVPGLGNLPILGSLFKSRSFQRHETELVIVITPYLVKPVNASDVRLPTDGFRSATELQGLLGNRESDGQSGVRAPMPSIAPSGSTEQPAPAPGPQSSLPAPAQQADKRKSKPVKSAANDAPTPGFSF